MHSQGPLKEYYNAGLGLQGGAKLARRRKLLTPGAEQSMDRFKNEVAEELGLADKIAHRGWGEMTARECGKVGGTMVKKMVKMVQNRLAP